MSIPPFKSNKKISLFSLSSIERAGERSDWFLGQIEMLPGKREHLNFEKRPNPPAPFPLREGGERKKKRCKFPPLRAIKKFPDSPSPL
ncbi:MAG: hypothetical protein ACRC8Y_07200 [Chroococcales cyanobacterium]